MNGWPVTYDFLIDSVSEITFPHSAEKATNRLPAPVL